MIQLIELWDFESHEHTVLDDISPALNLLCGESNSGKTSIVRALRLAAHNEFDPRSVRVGATKCVVLVKTERGSVKVTRGPKHNLWEVTRTGQPTQYFDKVGTNIVPEAEAIIGLNIVTLGDVQVPINIMDQLESHFMLAGVGGKDATGSMRAQIVDEISGLSGIEGLIKDVSLDRHRYGREITETEKAMETVRAQLHPEAALNEEDETLGKAEKELTDHKTMVALAAEGDGLIASGKSVEQQMSDLNHRAAQIPDTDLALAEIARAGDLTDRADSAAQLHREGSVSSGRLASLTTTLSGLPDGQAASAMLNESEAANRVLTSAVDILGRWTTASQGMKAKQDREKVVTEALKAADELEKAQDAIVLCSSVELLLDAAQQLSASILGKKRGLDDKGKELQEAEKDRDALLASITTCPLTLKPVSKECLEGATA